MSRKMTNLDQQLQELALTDWAAFVQLIGEDAIVSAKVCLLRKEMKSYGEICVKLGLTRDQVRYGCEKC